ncbi:hypothetical protein B0H65DRAFT_506611 [Neurospora tetraspora]|uniref:Alcohol dehydrogenase-like C-terminal domain-containing protein n=1 Tax=Neurospora tetraspora TaxID=94610 RepID=A0AAE0JKZ5_9PEZI|nr:hypothetical protein B0H65DRAFT_506611 [Neurospora tetraspora]
MCGIPLGLCGSCWDCTATGKGREGGEHYKHYCAHIDGHIGIQVDGVFAEYAIVDSRTSTVIPEGVSLLAAAPLGCAGRTAWRAVKEAGLQPGQWLGIVGSGGGLGHLAVQFATKMGLKVVGVEARDGGLELTREMGADVVVDARMGKDEVVREIGKAVLGDDGKEVDHNGLFATGGVDATVNLSDADDAAGLACAITKMHGLMVQVAQPLEVKIPFMELIIRDVRIKGSLQCSGEESEELLRFVAEHGVKVKMTPFYGLDQVEELEKVVSSGKLQGRAAIIVDPHQLQQEKEIVRH